MRSSKAVVILGLVAAVSAALVAIPGRTSEGAEPGGPSDQAAEIARLKDEIEQLKGMLPDQSHRRLARLVARGPAAPPGPLIRSLTGQKHIC